MQYEQCSTYHSCLRLYIWDAFLIFHPQLWNNCDITKLFQRQKNCREAESHIDFPIAKKIQTLDK